MNKTLVVLLTVLGFLFLALAAFYWLTPAMSLPHYFPGYELGVRVVHVKHGIAAFIVALALFVVAWFASGEKKTGI